MPFCGWAWATKQLRVLGVDCPLASACRRVYRRGPGRAAGGGSHKGCGWVGVVQPVSSAMSSVWSALVERGRLCGAGGAVRRRGGGRRFVYQGRMSVPLSTAAAFRPCGVHSPRHR